MRLCFQGVKLVRGAYLGYERERAARLGLPSPIWPSEGDTHRCYDACAELLLHEVQRGRAEVLLGTHNQVGHLGPGGRDGS